MIVIEVQYATGLPVLIGPFEDAGAAVAHGENIKKILMGTCVDYNVRFVARPVEEHRRVECTS